MQDVDEHRPVAVLEEIESDKVSYDAVEEEHGGKVSEVERQEDVHVRVGVCPREVTA